MPPARASLALASCGGEPAPPPLAVVVPTASASAAAPRACNAWPLAKGCVVALGAADGRLCALTRERAFCWGATGQDPAPSEVVEVDRARAGRPERCTGGRCSAPRALTIPLAPAHGLASASDVEAVAVGREHACALAHEKILCSGGGWLSLRGERAASRGHEETNVVALPPARDVVALERTTCALTISGEVHCWGDGRLFPPGALAASAERITSAAFFGDLAAGCFLGATGRVSCGAAGDFAEVPALAGAKELAARPGSACARLEGGRVACWSPGGVAEAPWLAPAARLLEDVPCALLEGGKLRCEAWSHRENGETVDFPKAEHALPSPIRATAPHAPLGRPGTCLLGEKGEVSCYGVITGEWGTEPAMAGTRVSVLSPRGEIKPALVPGLKDVVELGPSCARTQGGKVWLIGVASGADPKKLRLSAASPKGADGAVALEPGGCVGRRADGTRFRVVPPLLGDGPSRLGAPTVEPFAPPPAEPLAPGLGPPTLRHGQHRAFACALRADAGVACRQRARDGSPEGPLFDPLHRSTLPLRVIPPPER